MNTHQVRIISKLDHRVLTFVEELDMASTVGKRGLLVATPSTFTNETLINQRWELQSCPMMGPGVFSIHLARNPNFVIRHTPMAPRHKILVWQNEPGTPLQMWKIVNGRIFNLQNPAMSLNTVGGNYGLGMIEEVFYLDVATSPMQELA